MTDSVRGTNLVVPKASDQERLVAKVRGLLTFEDCPTILRASGLSSLLSRFGRVFQSAHGSAYTYQLSAPVEKIDFFLSHNWAIERWRKYLCLSIHFNFVPAVIVTAGVLAVAAVLSAQGYFPAASAYEQFEGWKDPAWREGFVCQVIALPVFLSVLFFWQDILLSLGIHGPSTFLDKACIHQEDSDIMRKGIERLGAFIMRSDKMLILYTELYLSKLWTIYEVAASLTLNGGASIHVIHMNNSVLLLCMLVATWCTSMGYILIHEFGGSFLTFYAVMGVLSGFCFRHLRLWQIRKNEAELRIATFDVRACTCAVETDRPAVYLNISRLMRFSESVIQNASQEEALDAFNLRVRSELLKAFHASSSASAFQYYHYVVLGWLISGGKGLDMLVSLDRGLDPRYLLSFNLNVFAWVFGVWPLCYLLLGKVAAANTHLKGWRKVLWIIVGFCSPFVFGILMSVVTQTVRHRSETSDAWLLAGFVMGPVLVSAALSLMFWEGRSQRRSRTTLQEQTEKIIALKSVFSTNTSLTGDDACRGVASSRPTLNGDMDIDPDDILYFPPQDDQYCGEVVFRDDV